MNAEELTVQRASLAVQVAKALREAGYTFIQSEDSSQTSFEVSHADLPEWHKFVTIFARETMGIQRNQLTIPGTFHTKDNTSGGIRRMLKALDRVKGEVIHIRQQNNELNSTLKRLGEQQEQDFRDLDVPDWVAINVNFRGELTGTYSVKFEPGSPVERLNAAQVKRLVNLVQEFE